MYVRGQAPLRLWYDDTLERAMIDVQEKMAAYDTKDLDWLRDKYKRIRASTYSPMAVPGGPASRSNLAS